MPPTDTSTSLGDHQFYGGDGEDDGDLFKCASWCRFVNQTMRAKIPYKPCKMKIKTMRAKIPYKACKMKIKTLCEVTGTCLPSDSSKSTHIKLLE